MADGPSSGPDAQAARPLVELLQTGHRRRALLRRAERDVRRREHEAKAAAARALSTTFQDLDAVAYGYARVREALRRLRWDRAEELGTEVAHGDVDPSRHRTLGTSSRYVVRFSGTTIDGAVIDRAILEPLPDRT